MNRIRILTIAFFLCIFTLAMAYAYIPTADRILDPLARMHRRVSTVLIHGETTVYGKTQAGEASLVPEKLYFEYRGSVRSERRLPGGEVILAAQGGRIFVSGTYGDLVNLRSIEAVLPEILLQRSTDRLIHDLSVLGVDTSVTAFDRIEQTICYVIGRHDGTPSGSALWVEKERGLPLRFTGFIALPDGIAALRAEYKDYGLVDKRLWFPRAVEFYRDDTLLARMDIRHIEIDPDIDAGFFNIPEVAATGTRITDFMSIKE